MACSIAEVKVGSLKLCESLLFSNLFHIFILVLLEDKQNGKSRGVIYHGFYPLLAMVYECFKIYYMSLEYVLEYFQVQVRFGALLVFWSLLESFEVHNYIDISDFYIWI